MRKFEKIKGFEDAILPKRATKFSAGYDLFAYEEVVIPGQAKIKYEINSVLDGLAQIASQILDSVTDEEIIGLSDRFDELAKVDYESTQVFNILNASEETKDIYDDLMKRLLNEANIDLFTLLEEFEVLLKPVLVKTGIKVKMPNDEFLALYNRSSGPKNKLILANGVGVVDSDYYGNADNDGNIMVQFINLGYNDITIKKGQKVAQGIFTKFYKVDDEEEVTKERASGHGSTGI